MRRILVVEDDGAVAALVRRALDDGLPVEDRLRLMLSTCSAVATLPLPKRSLISLITYGYEGSVNTCITWPRVPGASTNWSSEWCRWCSRCNCYIYNHSRTR